MVKGEQVQDTKHDKTKRWHRDPNCHRPILSNRTWKNRYLGNWGFTANNCVTEVNWWNQSVHSVWEVWPVFSSLYCICLQSLYLSIWQWKVRKLPSSLQSMQQNHNIPKQASSNNPTNVLNPEYIWTQLGWPHSHNKKVLRILFQKEHGYVWDKCASKSALCVVKLVISSTLLENNGFAWISHWEVCFFCCILIIYAQKPFVWTCKCCTIKRK